jgi:lysophospholipase L1-like esterase
VQAVIEGYRQIIMRAKDRGVRVIGATILPFGGTSTYRSDADADADRRAINAWIRAPGNFDAVLDLDDLMRDPAHPERLSPAYDRGDRLHPSREGQDALGNAIPLSVFLSKAAASRERRR